MNPNATKEIRDKARLTNGLLTVLKDDIDVLRYDVNNGDILNLLTSTHNTKKTLEQLREIIDEIEHILYANAI